MAKKALALPDTNQTFWQLTSIQVMTYGLPCILIGVQTAKDSGVGTACLSILIGNLVLWMVGRAMIAMSSDGRSNAIQNIGNYFGVIGVVIANFVLGAAFLIWFPINLEYAVSALDGVIPGHLSTFNYLCIALGILIALLASGGIVLIRKICVLALPLVGLLFLSSLFLFESKFHFGSIKFSLMGTISVILVSFVGMINLPTFFRHSRSKADSIIGLTSTTFFVSIFQCIGIVSGFLGKFNGSSSLYGCGSFCAMVAVMYVVISTMCASLGSVYFSSAVLEFFLPKARKSIGYVVFGLCGTLLYVLVGFSNVLVFVENIVGGFIVNLSVVLLLGFICKIVVHHRPIFIEKLVNNICWFLGCVVSFYATNRAVSEYYGNFYMGVVAVILSFIVFLFIERTVLSVRDL